MDKVSMKKQYCVVCLLVLLVAWAVPVHAVLLVDNTFVPLSGTTVLDRPELEGLVLEDNLVPFTVGDLQGEIQERVVREYGSGTLDFYWRVTTDASSAGDLTAFRVGNFVTSSYDADWRIDGDGVVGPDGAYKFSGSFDSYFNFLFDSSGVVAGESSKFMFLHTDATTYDRSAIMDVWSTTYGQRSELFSTFAPGTKVPDAGSTLLLFGGAMAAIATLRRKLSA